MRKLTVFLCVMVLAFVGVANATNLVLDGGFEGLRGMYDTGPLGAWTVNVVAGRTGVYGPGDYSGANVTEGNVAFDIGEGGDSPGNSLFQTLATIAGMTYNLSFDWGSEYDWGTYSTVTVGTALSEILTDVPNNAAGVWIDHSSSFSFIADGNDVLTFTDNSSDINVYSGGLILDNIVVVESTTPIPEPSTILLLGTGIISLAGFRKKFKK